VRVDQCVEIYFKKKQACGYSYKSIVKVLRRFARSTGKVNISLITGEHVLRFLSQSQISNSTWRAYAWHLRNFFRYWYGRQQIAIVPQVLMKPATKPTFVPYIYTRQEIRTLLDATFICQGTPKCIISPLTLRTLILFLYGTGIKIGDALTLFGTDVDLAQRTIRVRGTTVQERMLPIGRDVKNLLRAYLSSAERLPFGVNRLLFLDTKGRGVSYDILCKTFIRLRKVSGIKRYDSSYQPRMHDLRHSFAVHSIAKWHLGGLDLDHVLPMLATYMGNLDMHGLERYLELSPCNYGETLKRLYSYGEHSVLRKRA
jgi:integrase/recombinase XerD